jgi:arabinose-5-phosphate isomerase
VRDIMHIGNSIPLVAAGTRMADAMVEMSAKGFGCVGITNTNGKLVGIVTDGDLRRHMRADLLDVRVDDVMTRNPKTIKPDQLASEALEIINSSKITALIVAKSSKPVGIVHFHDLLRAGVA